MSNVSVKFLDDVGGSPVLAIVRGGSIVEAAELSLPALLMLAGQVMSALARRGHIAASALPEVSGRPISTSMH